MYGVCVPTDVWCRCCRQVISVLSSVVRPGADSTDSALLAPDDLQRTLMALARCAKFESSHDDIASFCMPSLAVLLHSLLASVELDSGTGGDELAATGM